MNHSTITTPLNPRSGARVSRRVTYGARARRFHRALLEGCGNDVLLDGFDRLWTAGELARRWSGAATPDRDADAEHRALEEAALSRDPGKAATLLRRHILRTVDALTRLP
ncbi:FCD domain-containing protein [Nonomuraea sp. NPDC049504]|uniref:FCD domain-containing protein n=1 Tax=Nonomuraea sp. NPDC049504 TaxID=3154729 RepID=UPI0034184662